MASRFVATRATRGSAAFANGILAFRLLLRLSRPAFTIPYHARSHRPGHLVTIRTIADLIAEPDWLSRPDYNAVVARVCNANPPRTINPDGVGVIGFNVFYRGEVLSLAAGWAVVEAGRGRRVRQERLFSLRHSPLS